MESCCASIAGLIADANNPIHNSLSLTSFHYFHVNRTKKIHTCQEDTLFSFLLLLQQTGTEVSDEIDMG
jgi:hypothetical protein